MYSLPEMGINWRSVDALQSFELSRSGNIESLKYKGTKILGKNTDQEEVIDDGQGNNHSGEEGSSNDDGYQGEENLKGSVL